MAGIIHYEAELRVLNVDPEDVVKRIENFGGRKLFDGELESRLYETKIVGEPLGTTVKKSRLRWYKGVLYIDSSGEGIHKEVAKTEVIVKTKLEGGSFAGHKPRRYAEKHEDEQEGNQLDAIGSRYLEMGATLPAWDMRHRTSYIKDIIRFELDLFYKTKRLGDRRLPLMLEVETPDASLTVKVVSDLGYDLKVQPNPTTPFVVDWKLGQIFDYYDNQQS